MNQIYMSKFMADKLKELPETKLVDILGYSFPVVVSPLFPFEVMYDACDIETKHEVKIGSGEWIHGAMVPQIDLEIEPPSFEFSFDPYKHNLSAFMEQRWGTEIFKF
jgi:hypothetical protein